MTTPNTNSTPRTQLALKRQREGDANALPYVAATLETELQSALREVEELKQLQTSTTWPYVMEFALRMEAKLVKNRHKGDRSGWIRDIPFSLLNRIQDEWAELNAALCVGNVEQVKDEAADVANFAMMVADCFDNAMKEEK